MCRERGDTAGLRESGRKCAMDLESKIKSSEWWRLARETPDRHYDPTEGVMLADHLLAVLGNLRAMLADAPKHDYFLHLQQVAQDAGLGRADITEVLEPVALLHDIGKTREDKQMEIEHPLTGKRVKKRHPVTGVIAAREVLPEEIAHRQTILALIDEHDTPYAWCVQFRRNGQIPKRKSWARLDRKIDSREDGTGLILLCLFKMADVDGHEGVEDVRWFIDQANQSYFREKGKWLPVPESTVIEELGSGTDERGDRAK